MIIYGYIDQHHVGRQPKVLWEELQYLEATHVGHFCIRCLSDVVLGTSPRPTVAGKDQDKFDGQDREAVMLIKLSVTDEMLPEVQNGKTVAAIWKQLKETHEISDKGQAFFLKNMLFSIKMSEGASLQEHLLKIKDI
jgi:hypothetical protein